RIGLAAVDAGRAAGRLDIEAAMKNPDVAIAGNMHPNDLSPTASIHSFGQRRPALHQSVRVRKFCRFGERGLLSTRYRAPSGDDDGADDGDERQSHAT